MIPSIPTFVRSLVSVRFALSACALVTLGLSVGCQPDVFTPTPPPEDAELASSDGAGAGGAVAGDEQDIVGGTRDYGHPAVVALVVSGNKLCTGTLVGPRTVLTARHCVAETVEGVSCPPVGPQIGAQVDPAEITIVRGNDVASGEAVARGAKLFVPPGDALCEADLALVTLDRAVTGTRPLRISDETIAEGDHAVAVGFGRTADEGGAGKKRVRRDVSVVAFSERELWVGEATCHGDSGGPLLDGEGRVLGVLSRGGPGCSGAVENIYTRPSGKAFSKLIAAALAVPE